MNKYYLTFLKNYQLNTRSACTYNQPELFMMRVGKDYNKTLWDAKNGLPIVCVSYGCEYTLPTANTACWEIAKVLAFDRMQDAHRTARFIRSLSRTPKIVADAKREMKAVYDMRWPGVFHHMNSTDRVRYVPGLSPDVIVKLVEHWASQNEIDDTTVIC